MSERDLLKTRLEATINVLEGKEYLYKIDFQIRDMIKDMLHYIDNSIDKQEIRDKINYRQFELQQQYKDFKDDVKLNTLQEIYYSLGGNN